VSGYVNGEYYAKTLQVKVAKVKLTATPASGAPNVLSSFNAKWDNGETLNPADVTGWAWRPDSGGAGQTTPCAVGQTGCQRNVQESGWMTISVTHAGVASSDSAHVYIVSCPTNDPVLDDSIVRAGLSDMWNMSHASTFGQQVEIAGLIIDSAGVKRVLIKPTDPFSDGGCSVDAADWFTQPLPLGWSRVAPSHIHPAKHLQKVICSPGDTVKYDAKAYGGPSGRDWYTSRQYADSLNMGNAYLVDSLNIIRYNGAPVLFDTVQTPKGPRLVPKSFGLHGWHNGYSSWGRKNGSCRRV
jgi:hypothetical protein